jgi:hypothetical protein
MPSGHCSTRNMTISMVPFLAAKRNGVRQLSLAFTLTEQGNDNQRFHRRPKQEGPNTFQREEENPKMYLAEQPLGCCQRVGLFSR